MLTDKSVQVTVLDNVKALLDELGEADVVSPGPASSFPDLGVDSLMLARLIIELEEAFAVEPFENEEASVADLRTVADLVRVFEDALGT